MARYRIGIDVGGTFTDFVLVDMAETRLEFHKEPSVPGGSFRGGGSAVCGPSWRASASRSAMSSWWCTARPSASTPSSSGGAPAWPSSCRRATGTSSRSRGSACRAPTTSPPRARRPWCRAIGSSWLARECGRTGAWSRPRAPPSSRPSPPTSAAPGSTRSRVVLLNAYRDGSLERAVSGALRAALPEVQVSESSTIWPEVREYERCLVAALNAYIQPLMSGYLERLETRVAGQGVAAPIYITANNGGTLSVATARQRPIETVLSGPASGVVWRPPESARSPDRRSSSPSTWVARAPTSRFVRPGFRSSPQAPRWATSP